MFSPPGVSRTRRMGLPVYEPPKDPSTACGTGTASKRVRRRLKGLSVPRFPGKGGLSDVANHFLEQYSRARREYAANPEEGAHDYHRKLGCVVSSFAPIMMLVLDTKITKPFKGPHAACVTLETLRHQIVLWDDYCTRFKERLERTVPDQEAFYSQ